VARRRGKKVKQRIREDKFRDSVISITKKVNENKFFVITLIAVIILFSLGFYLRAQRKARRLEEMAEIVTNPDRLSLEDLKSAIDRYSDKKFAPWLWLALARRLFTEYRDNQMRKGRKEKLLEAEKAFRTIVERFKDSGTPFYCAKKMLTVIEKEKSFVFPWKTEEEEPSVRKCKALNWRKRPESLHRTFLRTM